MDQKEDAIGMNRVIQISVCADSTEKPSARSGHRAIADDSYLWVIGGYNPDRPESPLYREFWQLNLTTYRWSAVKCKGDMPVELASHSALGVGHYMIVFGGTNYPFGESSSNKVSICNLQTHKWICLDCTGQMPHEKYGQAMALQGDNLFIHGGTTGYFYNTDLHQLNLKTRRWEKLIPNNDSSEIPNERYRHELVVFKDNLFILGGGTSHDVLPLKKLHCYNTKLKRWVRLSTKSDACEDPGFPAPRRCHGCVQLQDDAFISGGYDGESIMDDIWKINLQSLQWTKIAIMPEPVYFHSAAASPAGCMYIFGGVISIGHNERTENCYRIWLRLPSLLTLCWQRLTSAYPQLLKVPQHKLRQIGVCKDLIAKLSCHEGA